MKKWSDEKKKEEKYPLQTSKLHLGTYPESKRHIKAQYSIFKWVLKAIMEGIDYALLSSVTGLKKILSQSNANST